MFFPGASSPTSAMNCEKWKDDDDSKHNQDVVMPGFRFHPTEEELVEFYLRRKVEGKHFNIELITLVDLYRYDPWELSALAAIGENEQFFYVPRDRKYRNGDRPNRVTASGYWKATGADRMIRNETSCCIGLKKTLVFYRGKAPKGKRTSWIMNEYRLPQLETEKIKKSELSLCRVYKRAGTEDDHIPSKESRNLSVKMNGNSQSSTTAGISDSFNIRPFEHHPGDSSTRNAYFNSQGFLDEIMELEGLPAALQNCDKGEMKRKCSVSVDERFPCQIDNGVAAFENIHQRIYSDDVHGNSWSASRPRNEDVQLSLNRCLYSRAPDHVALNTVQDLYNTPSHILGVVANSINNNNNNGSFATNYGSGIQLETTAPGVDYGSISRRYQTHNVLF